MIGIFLKPGSLLTLDKFFDRVPLMSAIMAYHLGSAPRRVMSLGYIEQVCYQVSQHFLRGEQIMFLLDRADVDALLVERHQEERQAVVARRSGFGSGDDEDPVGLLRPGRPHLLAVDHPFTVVEDGAGAHRGQVGAGSRL